ncbi:MAG TPA: C25 family cysteine peptidase [Flavisolibacter sp.]|jgi:hypothetical protein|nr:C25 family cysteine peptidase [Flavisolibacter sp.]
MKKLLLGLLLISGFIAKAQVYNNEWIDYSKTYYKFKVGKTGLYRISQSVLSSAGLGIISAEYFQLWRNGKQIPIYTSVATGSLSSSDYMEFWGEMNDGKPDRELYRDPNWQLNDKWSLETDTAAYFLTVNTNISSNLRLQTTANNVTGTTLPVDTYFMYKTGKYFRDRINSGYAVNVGDNLYSSSYDKGEGWSSTDVITTFNSSCVPTYGKNSFIFSNLNIYKGPSAPAPKFKIAVSGNQINQRRFYTQINSDSVIGNQVDFFNYTVDSTNFSLATLNGMLDTVSVYNYSTVFVTGCSPSDRMTIHKYEITYPRNFNFNGQTNFEFTLNANVAGNYLQITNFNYGSSNPVLYDLTNGKRYVADLSSAPTLKFVLDPSLTSRNLVLVNEDVANINAITTLQTRNFINYTDASNQGDYLIISDPLLFAGAGGINPVNEYKVYRSSATGGSYNAKIYLAQEIIDQFGFGIKKNPAAIRDFLRYARKKFSVTPKHVFIIGRGMTYPNQLAYESYPNIDQLNLVPTFGFPASDALLVAEPGSSQPEMSIGRLSVIYPAEVSTYLKKIKEFEQAQAFQSPLIKDKAWMKNVIHVIGAGDAALDAVLSQNMDAYKDIIKDTLYGADVFSFNKTSTDAVSQISDKSIEYLINNGLSMITYFGHSSATTLQFNLDNPENYSNYTKYPLFLGLGCNVGSFFGYSTLRLQTYKETLSEKYVLAPDRGMIGVVGSTHFGIVHYLNIWAERAYQHITYKSYDKSIGEIIKETAADVFQYTTQEDFYARCNAEETLFHGDPAIHLNPHSKPDYAIEDSMVKISPNFLSVQDQEFKVDAQFLNIGKSPDSNIVIEVKRFRQNETTPSFVKRDTIPGIRYAASMSVKVPIDPTKDKGLNKIVVTVDADNNVDELFENNNSVTKDVMIYEDEATPTYPYNYAIVNTQNIKLIASTANPFAIRKQYQMELDTTELFNSPLKVTKIVDSSGGIMEFDPGITFTNNTVYYWRVAPVVTTGSPSWNTSSFIYLTGSDVGFNQSHFYQQTKADGQNISLDSTSRKWKFGTRLNNLFIRQGSWVTSVVQQGGVTVAINGDASLIRSTCYYQSLVFNVFDPVTFRPMANQTLIPENSPGYPFGLGLYGSYANQCSGFVRQYNFEYRYTDSATRKKIMDFMKNGIPDGSYVVIRNFTLDPVTFPNFPQAFISDFQADASVYGQGQTLYDYLKNAGLASIDSFYRARPFALVYKKNDPSFSPKWVMGDGVYDNPTLSVDCVTPDTAGVILSPVFGPAKAWKELRWNGASMDSKPGDNARIDVIGIKNDGVVDTLIQNINTTQATVDVSSINATTYRFIQLVMHNADSVNVTPYQLNYWRLTYLPAPEGAVNASQAFSISDTLEVGQPLQFKMAFKNITNTDFSDSMRVKIVVTDHNNVKRVITSPNRLRILKSSPDTLNVNYQIDTRQLAGANTLYVEVNPENDQPEQYHFNNFFYKNFYIRGDTLNPLLDVTFDNVHILNHDIVSAKPTILIKLKDEAKWNLLDDPSKIKVQLHKMPQGTRDPGYLRDYKFDADTLLFQPANQAPPTNNNTANAIFKPQLEDGEYELIISATDMSDNSAGPMQYRVAFQVINKPMISNMLNYPNPFTTSTAFVFTLTGSEVPQNIRIQILTVTGKIVREILKDELGPLHIGRNITEFKWDGTDQYGQKLANGVYLYRVITNLNGKSLDKYTSGDDNTDKYFNKGYGKMYLMR